MCPFTSAASDLVLVLCRTTMNNSIQVPLHPVLSYLEKKWAKIEKKSSLYVGKRKIVTFSLWSAIIRVSYQPQAVGAADQQERPRPDFYPLAASADQTNAFYCICSLLNTNFVVAVT